MKWLTDLESVGWVFWLVLFVLLVYPGYLFMEAMTYSSATTVTRIGLGTFGAAMVSGLLSAGINELLHRWKLRKNARQRKVDRKEKRKRRK